MVGIATIVPRERRRNGRPVHGPPLSAREEGKCALSSRNARFYILTIRSTTKGESSMKRTRRLTANLDVAFRIPRPGLTQRQLAILTKAFKNLLVATLAVPESQGVGPLTKQKKAIKSFKKVTKTFQSLKRKPASKRRR
jgi:hypothetical protein